MKWLFFSFFCLMSLFLRAQHPVQPDAHSVVRDATGKTYPYKTWQSLVSQGRFTLRAKDPKDSGTIFLLLPLTGSEKEERMRRLPPPGDSAYFTRGQKISPFTTTDLEGNPVDLRSLEGKIVVINFWFVNCGPCRREIPELNRLVDSFKTDERVVFLGVALDERRDLEKFLKQFPFHYRILDAGRGIAAQYGIRFYPTHVILDTGGRVYFHTSGLSDNTVYWLGKSIGELLAREKP
ncbi:MAG: TlpA family protein disulfide reductase [Flavisolibacter sp.]